jgi:nucleoside phosphorylase
MVGIGGGVSNEENDIQLGDIVVSKPTRQSRGVIQYDFGKTVQEGRFN